MIKKAFLLLILLFTAVSGLVAGTPGSWQVLQMSGVTIDNVVDTPRYVYYLTGGVLYAYDKDNDETTFFSPGTKVSDSGIVSIRYNDKEKYLLCIYGNCNLDLIYDDGRIVNMPDIKNAKISGDKKINAVSFGDGRFYVATSFGIVVCDDERHAVVESGIYNKNVMQAQEFGDYLVIFADYYLHYSPKSIRHNTFDKFTRFENVGIDSWQKIDDSSYICIFRDDINICRFDISAGTVSQSFITKSDGASAIEPMADGYLLVTDNNMVVIDKAGGMVSATPIPVQLKNHKMGAWKSMKSVWAADNSGIGNYDIDGGAITVISDKYRPESSKQFNSAFAYTTPDGNETYFNGIGNSTYHPSGDINGGYGIPLLLESYEWGSGKITPRYPELEKQLSDNSQLAQNESGLNLLYGGPGQTVIDPEDASFVYHANNYDGLIVLKDGELFYHYDRNNSPIVTGSWGSRAYGLCFDNQGNLWIAHWGNSSHNGTSPLKVISKESLQILRKNPETLTEKDAKGGFKHWQSPAWVENNSGWTDGKIVFAGNYGMYVDAEWDGPIVGIDTKGTLRTSDDKVVKFTGVTDQDGNVIKLYTKTSLLKDRNNHVWIGTDAGVYILKDAKNLVDDSSNYLSVTRPKVPRNDGTNYADYLLDTDKIICMAVDPTNRKWIGTAGSGMFLVNESGTEILEEINKDNSPLVSNTITMIACDPKGNEVLVGTPEGLFLYSSDASPAADDYSEVIAYPNPVRPEYSGMITIKGLMDNSLVKISDIKGNVVWNGRSEGGLAVWDGCDAAGNRVNSGVYMVYTSQNASGLASGAVTKIVVIN